MSARRRERHGRRRRRTPDHEHTGPHRTARAPRGILFAIVLAIVTLGIYSLYWVFKTQEEVKAYSGNGIGGVLGLVISILLSPVTWFVVPSEVGKKAADGRRAPYPGWTGLWLLLPLIGAVVWFVKVQGALNRYWESKAASSSVPAVV